MKYYFTPLGRLLLKTNKPHTHTEKTSTGKDVEKLEPSFIVGAAAVENSLEAPQN